MTAESKQPQRPLSPFMIGTYYRPQLTSMLSIFHRATGVFLAVGALGLALWLMALAGGKESFDCFAALTHNGFGTLVLVGFSYALMYHLCNGIRHLFWDAGYGYEIKTAYRSGYAVVAVSIVLTALTWVVAYSC